VAVRASFQCRSCHFLSPLDELDIDGSVECAQCTMHQRFDVAAWTDALAFAHGVGDLGFPPPEGRAPNPHVWIGEDNPHIRLGYTDVFAEHRQSSTTVQAGVTVHRSLFIQASPGHPVCHKCGGALRISIMGERTNARCDECGEQPSHQLPPGARSYAAKLVGVVALAHRVDKPLALLDSHGGTDTLKCGQCGGDLEPTRDRVVECRYCNATNLVPARARARDHGSPIKPEVWWLAFVGPSAARRALEAPALVGGALTSYFGGETHLEQAPKKDTLNFKQLALSLVLPTIALVLGYFIVVAFGLHKIAFF
jgi:DNA-directed RNA polymerase subunit RPC12/RpoP